jgi:hypothetical protein
MLVVDGGQLIDRGVIQEVLAQNRELAVCRLRDSEA